MVTYRVICLAAGIGERLRPHTYDKCKCILRIGDKSIIEHWLDALIYSGVSVSTVHIIVGHYGYKVRNLLGRHYQGLKIQYSTNPLYKITGGAQSIYVASKALKHPTIIVEADHYVDPELMKMLFDSEFENCILVDHDLSKIKYDEEALAYGSNGLLKEIKYLPPYPEGTIGEAIGVLKLSKKASQTFGVILERYLMEHGPAKKDYTEPFTRLMETEDVYYIGTQGKEWIEIDFESDLRAARRMNFEETKTVKEARVC